MRDRLATRLRWWAQLPGNLRGGIYMLFATAAFVAMATLVKIAGQTLHIAEILLFRQAFMMVFVLPVILRDVPGAFTTHHPWLHVLRILFATGALIMGFLAFIHLPLADATTISFAKPLFVTMFAILLLSEQVGRRRWAALIVGFIGVLIVTRPGLAEATVSIYGFYAMAGAACAAMVMVLIRKITQSDRPVTILAFQAIGVGFAVAIPAVIFWKTPSLNELVLLGAIGAVSIFAQLGNILAYRAGEASAVAPVEYTRLLYAVAAGYVIFGDWPDWIVFVGAAIIIGSSFYTMRREARVKRVVAPPPPDVTA